MTTFLNAAITYGGSVRLLENRLSGEAQLRYAFTDHLGSTGGETDTHGNIISREEYYSFGSSAGGDEEAGEITDRTRRYSGKERDATGLLYYGWRYYQPGAGRWLSADPDGLIDGANLFRFCRSNPTTLRDADGRVPEPAEISRLAAWFRAQPRDALNGRLMAGWQTAPLAEDCDLVGLAWSLLTDVDAGNIAATELYAGLDITQPLPAQAPVPISVPASATYDDLALFDNLPPPSPVPFEELISLSTPPPSPTVSAEAAPMDRQETVDTSRSPATTSHRYSCTLCDKAFAFKGGLTTHLRWHTGERPYRCSECGKTYKLKGHLTEHLVIHSGEKPHRCNVCEKSFTYSHQLTSHKRIYTGIRPYICTTCGAAFGQQGHLIRHMNIHTGEKRHACDQCEATFAQSGNLKVHKRRHHQ